MDQSNPKELCVPFLTAELPGVGGVIKRYDEDFVVEEIPLYPACGEGTHVYFIIEKQGLTTPAAIDAIARALGRKRPDFGYAGLKDAHGVTRQTLSIEHEDPARVESLDLARIRVLSHTRHTNKLKLGHLSGNRFVIRIRETVNSPKALAEPIINVLSTRGLPNYFGPQRFGVRGDNAAIGRACLQANYKEAIALVLGRCSPHDRGEVRRARELFDAGDLEASAAAWGRHMRTQAHACRALLTSGGDPFKAWRAVDRSLRKLYLSAFQSDLFNQVLARRIETIDKLETGDLAWKHRNGACFLVEDASVEQPRCAAGEISPSGPLFGRKMSEPGKRQGQLEASVLAGSGVTEDQFHRKDGTRFDGARRPLRVPLVDSQIDEGEDRRGSFLRLSFTLPPGSYATCVTREVCKTVAVSRA